MIIQIRQKDSIVTCFTKISICVNSSLSLKAISGSNVEIKRNIYIFIYLYIIIYRYINDLTNIDKTYVAKCQRACHKAILKVS